MKLLCKGHLRMVRTTFAQDERLMRVQAFESALVVRYNLDKHGSSIVWFEDDAARVSWILSYSREIYGGD